MGLYPGGLKCLLRTQGDSSYQGFQPQTRHLIGERVWIDNLDKVVISNDVCISQGAHLLCGNHNYKSTAFDLVIAPIEINSGAWVGAKSIVCPGVKVGTHAILTLGSVAVNDLNPWCIYKGNPAEFSKQRTLID